MKRYTFKVLLLGAPSVGKTSIFYRYIKNQFLQDYITTIGINYLAKEIILEGKKIAKLVISDIAGHEKFKVLRKEFYAGANGALLIFDLTQLKTYEALEDWISEMFEILQDNIPFIIIGNKVDLVEEFARSIDQNIVRSYAEKKDSTYLETSAKTGENIEDVFKELAQRMIKRIS
ncbi:MAG: GTP-binding protein [Candidatus Lokiarchaeota archaeon]|nr:GTP-binding protein [Candidatus Lokiarchaeota archaeon]